MRRALLVAAALIPLSAQAADEDKGWLAGLISQALSSRATKVSIGAVEGALSSDATVRDIVLSDRDGPWLKIDHARLVWSRLALLKRRLEIDTLDIGHVEWSRPARQSASAPGAALEWPQLPLKAIVKHFRVENLDLGKPVLGAAALLSFTGSATLGSPAEGLDLTFAAKRLDAPGALDVRLAYAPKTTELALALDADEPQGGLVAGLAHLPGAPPVKLRFDGDGPLDAFHAKLAFAAGPDIGANGGVDLVREGAGRRLRLDLTARLAGLMPALAAPVFAGQTRLSGDVALADDGGAATQGLTLESDAAVLSTVGGVSADGVADLTVRAEAKASPDIGKLDFVATVKGPLPHPAANVSLDVENLKSPAGALAHLAAHFAAAPGEPVKLTGDAEMSGLALADPARAALVGHAGRLRFAATATPDGALDIADLTLDAEALRAHYAGKAARDALSGQLSADADDLSRLSGLACLKLKGSAHVEAALSGDPARGEYGAQVNAAARGFSSGEPALDGFSGASPTMRGEVKLLADGYAFDKLAIDGAGGRALIDGDAASLVATLTIPDAHRLDPRIAGAIAAQAKQTGPLTGDVTASLTDGRLLGRPARLDLTAHVDKGAAMTLTLGGDIDGQSLNGGVGVARADDTLTLDHAEFTLGKTRISGAGALKDGLADGKLTISAPRLADLSPLALTPLSGALQADLDLSTQAGQQSATIRARSSDASFGAARLTGLAVDMALTDLYGAARAEGTAAAQKIVAAGETAAGVKLLAHAGSLDLSASLRGLALRAKGALDMVAPTLRLDAFTARGKGGDIALSQPAMLAFDADGVATKSLALRLGAGRLALQGRAGARLDLKAKADAIPLAFADFASPGLGLAGTASGEAHIAGDATAPSGDWRLALAGVAAPASRRAGLPPLDVNASGKLAGGRSSLDATVSAGAAGTLHVSGSAPVKAGALDLKATGRLDIAALTRTLAARGQRASGTLTLDARLAGDPAHPKAEGSAVLSGGAFFDEVAGVNLTDLAATLNAHGDEIEIARASARTPGGGTVSASGHVRIDPAAGFPGAIRLTADNARLIATDIVTADAGLSLDVSGPLARAPQVAGRIDVKALDVEIPGRLPGAAAPLADVRHIAPGPTARAHLAALARKRRAAGPAFLAALALDVSAPSRITVHGRGIDAEFGGRLKVEGTTAAPHMVGGFSLLRGALTLIGGPMTFSRGQVSFEGDAMPTLDLEARQALSDATAIVDVTGPADKPVFAFTSAPELPQDEILSRLLFQKPSGNLSAFQALQLANTVSALSGNGGAFDSLRRSLGVDSLDVSTGANGGPALSARRALGERLSLGVKTGARPEDNGVSLDLDVTKRLRLSTGVDAKGESSLGAGLQWEY